MWNGHYWILVLPSSPTYIKYRIQLTSVTTNLDLCFRAELLCCIIQNVCQIFLPVLYNPFFLFLPCIISVIRDSKILSITFFILFLHWTSILPSIVYILTAVTLLLGRTKKLKKELTTPINDPKNYHSEPDCY